MLKYDEFIQKVKEAGYLTPFTNYISSDIFTFSENGQAYTGDPETDTTIWNTRAAQEKKLACGYFFNGKQGGFIAPHFYSIFIDAFKPRLTVEERYLSGKLGEYEWMVWNVFNNIDGPICWSQIWQSYGIKDTVKRRMLDTALKNLQISYDIAVCGIIEGLNKNGTTYKFVGYDKVENCIPAEWMKMNPHMEHQEALEIIYRQAEKISNIGEAKKAFSKSLKIYNSFC